MEANEADAVMRAEAAEVPSGCYGIPIQGIGGWTKAYDPFLGTWRILFLSIAAENAPDSCDGGVLHAPLMGESQPMCTAYATTRKHHPTPYTAPEAAFAGSTQLSPGGPGAGHGGGPGDEGQGWG